jgi:hypothetical protein
VVDEHMIVMVQELLLVIVNLMVCGCGCEKHITGKNGQEVFTLAGDPSQHSGEEQSRGSGIEDRSNLDKPCLFGGEVFRQVLAEGCLGSCLIGNGSESPVCGSTKGYIVQVSVKDTWFGEAKIGPDTIPAPS